MYLGIDLGTSGVKIILIDGNQRPLGEVNAPLTLSRPQDGWSEQDPLAWVSAVEALLNRLSKQHNLLAVRGIGLSGQMHGAILLGKDDAPLRPAILWNDTRAHREAQELDENPIFRARSGNIVFPGFTAPKLNWVKTYEPELFDRIAKVLLPKDFLRLWLTGEHVSEMSDAAGTDWLDTGKRDWDDALLAATDLNRAHMPDLVEGSEVSGHIRPDLASKWGMSDGVVVAGGAGDNAATGIGMGVINPGQGFVSLGTSGVLFAANDRFAPAPETAVHTFCHALPSKWHQMGVILAATDALNWLSQLTGVDPAALTQDIGPLRPPTKACFLPYLGGERTPLNNAAIRGAFTGLGHETDRDQATRSVLEGVAFALRDCQEALAATGTQIESLIASGGGARSRYWLEVIATVLNCAVTRPVSGDYGAAFGAARLAILAAEGNADLSAPDVAEIIEPHESLRDAFEAGYDRYGAAQSAIVAIS